MLSVRVGDKFLLPGLNGLEDWEVYRKEITEKGLGIWRLRNPNHGEDLGLTQHELDMNIIRAARLQ